MYYSGYFRNTDTSVDSEGQLYKVVIITNFQKNELQVGGELMLSDSPFTVTYESEDGNIFKPYKCSTATVGLLQENFNFEFSNTTGNNVLVMLLKFKNGRKEEDIKDSELRNYYTYHLQRDNICYNVEWIGFATPNTYSQEFENFFDSFELEAQDALSTLQYIPYKKDFNKDLTYISFIDILNKYCGLLRCYKNIYVSDNLRVPTVEEGDIFNFLYIDQRNFFDEDVTPKTALEVIEDMCKYLNVSIIPYNDSLYIVDYTSIKSGINSYFDYLSAYLDVYPFTLYSEQDKHYNLIKDKVNFKDLHDIKESDFSSTGTKLSLLSTYNRMNVKDSLYSFDSISPNFEDVNRWVYSKYYDVPSVYDENNVITEANDIFITDVVPNGVHINFEGNPTPREFVEWDALGAVRRNFKDPNLSVICNQRNKDKKQKVYIKYISLNDEDFFNNSNIETFAYNLDSKDSSGKISFGSKVNNEGTYNFTRKHICSQLIASDTVDVVNWNEHPKKLELKPSILISLPSSFTSKDYIEKNFNPFSSDYSLPPILKVKSKSVCIGSGDYLVISYKVKFYKNNDCLPIDEGNDETKYSGSYMYAEIKYDGKFMDGSSADLEPSIRFGKCYNYPLLATKEDNAYNKEYEIKNSYNFKELLGVENGIVHKFAVTDTENSASVGNIEFILYRPFLPVECGSVLISDFEIKLVTKSEINSINPIDDDTDTEYSNIIDEDSIEEKSTVDLDITTWDNKQPNYSSVIYSDRLTTFAGDRNYFRLQQLFNRSTGELLRAEEQIINNNIIQYSTPTVSLNLNLHKKPYPFSTFTYHYFKDKLFIVDGCELDYVNNSYNINLIEKK